MAYKRPNNWPRGMPKKKKRNAKIVHQREVLHWTYEKIAEKHGITASRVFTIIKRAHMRGEIQ